MATMDWSVGDVAQIAPEFGVAWAACLMVVTEVKTWGLMGYVRVPGEDGGNAFIRVPFDKLHRVGRAEWVRADYAADVSQ